jgi:hypothetical protein
MIFSAWQDAPRGIAVPSHPSNPEKRANASATEDFAAASIAVDIAGYRSRIFAATSVDGMTWRSATCILEGGGYESDEPDAIHAEDMALVRLDEKSYRMYYASCDRRGKWRVMSATGTENRTTDEHR